MLFKEFCVVSICDDELMFLVKLVNDEGLFVEVIENVNIVKEEFF